jgi:thiomorpholine-carboxylate dehydrogenase
MSHQSLNELLLLGNDDVRRCLNMHELVDSMSKALGRYSENSGSHPVRTVLPLSDAGSMFVMPAVEEIPAVKIVTLNPGNVALGLPTHHAVIIAFDSRTGMPVAVMEATYLTEMRTAAASAAALKALAPDVPRRIGIVGSGVQARGHHDLFSTVFGVEEFSVWSPGKDNLRRFCEETGARACASAEEAARDADVVIAATSSRQPVLHDDWIRPGAVVISVGAPMPDMRELGDSVMANAVYVDSRAACLVESGDVIRSGCRVEGEIGEVINGSLSVDASRTRVFKSGGIAIEDAAAAALVLKNHCARVA